MNKKGQFEIHPFSLIGGAIGGFFGVYIADKMFAGGLMKIIVFIVCALACFFVTNLIANKD